jgi:hemoglobin
MAKEEQLASSGERAEEKNLRKAETRTDNASSGQKPAQAESKLTLFDRLGGEAGIAAIVDDFTPRVMQDPRVNWQRQGIKDGGLFRRNTSIAWNPSQENIAKLKKHLVQFLALATGGPTDYDGKGMKSIHAGMRISNPEFDAVIGDLKASLDRLQIPDKEQKELLAIIESTRPQIVTER